ncbi:MAG: hypothetical protein NDI63_07255 [Pseudobdellovibrio sp.]|nr:hypothetical protein [Pseudobdellovibrio sp.]
MDAEFRAKLIDLLEQDIIFFEAGRFESMGKGFDAFEAEAYGNAHRPGEDINFAYEFYEAWLDENSHNYKINNCGFLKNEWPKYAQIIVHSLKHNSKITDSKLISNFSPEAIAKKNTESKKILVMLGAAALAVIFLIAQCYRDQNRTKQCLNKLNGEWNYKKPGCE